MISMRPGDSPTAYIIHTHLRLALLSFTGSFGPRCGLDWVWRPGILHWCRWIIGVRQLLGFFHLTSQKGKRGYIVRRIPEKESFSLFLRPHDFFSWALGLGFGGEDGSHLFSWVVSIFSETMSMKRKPKKKNRAIASCLYGFTGGGIWC